MEVVCCVYRARCTRGTPDCTKQQSTETKGDTVRKKIDGLHKNGSATYICFTLYMWCKLYVYRKIEMHEFLCCDPRVVCEIYPAATYTLNLILALGIQLFFSIHDFEYTNGPLLPQRDLKY